MYHASRVFHSIEKWTLGLVPIFGGRAIKWGLIIAYLGYLVQSVQGKVNTVEHMDYTSLEDYRHTSVMLFMLTYAMILSCAPFGVIIFEITFFFFLPDKWSIKWYECVQECCLYVFWLSLLLDIFSVRRTKPLNMAVILTWRSAVSLIHG